MTDTLDAIIAAELEACRTVLANLYTDYTAQRDVLKQVVEERNELRAGWNRDCEATDEILRHLGLEPERCRTEGGALNVGRIKADLSDRLAALASAEPDGYIYETDHHFGVHRALTDEHYNGRKPDRVIPYYLHPDTRGADAVDAARYRWLVRQPYFVTDYISDYFDDPTVQTTDLANLVIDSAMLAGEDFPGDDAAIKAGGV